MYTVRALPFAFDGARYAVLAPRPCTRGSRRTVIGWFPSARQANARAALLNLETVRRLRGLLD